MNRKYAFRIAIWTIIAVNVLFALVFVAQEALNLTSANSSIYLVRGMKGGFEVKRDLSLEEVDRLVYSVDANRVFDFLLRGLVAARNKPALELSWDEARGKGTIKEFIPGGKILALSFSRFDSEAGDPAGLFLGGDLPYADPSRSRTQNSSGFGYFDGAKWHHIWCVTNESLTLTGGLDTAVPPLWKFLGSKVVVNTEEKVILESEHETVLEGSRIIMKRIVSFTAGDPYFVLRVRLTNPNPEPINYIYSWGDEPWVGEYGSSAGDVGWYEGGIVEREALVQPSRYRYAGYWDMGNKAAGEKGMFSGQANFVEWVSPVPTFVFFANSGEKCCSDKTVLSSDTNRTLGIVWDTQLLAGESMDYTLAVGMIDKWSPEGMPIKPVSRTD